MPSISDQEILNLINAGLLKHRNGIVSKFHMRRKRYYQLTPTHHPISGRARYNIRLGSDRQRTIYRNKLVWMFTHRRLVSNGCDIDHRNGDNTDDHPGNLNELGSSDNRRRNWTDEELQEVLDYFDRCASGLED